MHTLHHSFQDPIRRLAAGTGLAMILTFAGLHPVQASVLQVSPVRMQFESRQQAQALQISNNGSQPLDAQVRIQRWTQENGEDRLEATDDIVVSPAIVQIAPGQQQTVRLIRVKPMEQRRELSYRVIVDELPGKQAKPPGSGLKVLMRYSIPVFIAEPAAEARTQRTRLEAQAPTDLSHIHARLQPGPDGTSILHVRNVGPTHVRISNLLSSGPGEARQVLNGGLLGYVLPGQQMSWPVKLSHPLPAGLTLKARFNDDREARALPLVPTGL